MDATYKYDKKSFFWEALLPKQTKINLWISLVYSYQVSEISVTESALGVFICRKGFFLQPHRVAKCQFFTQIISVQLNLLFNPTFWYFYTDISAISVTTLQPHHCFLLLPSKFRQKVEEGRQLFTVSAWSSLTCFIDLLQLEKFLLKLPCKTAAIPIITWNIASTRNIPFWHPHQLVQSQRGISKDGGVTPLWAPPFGGVTPRKAECSAGGCCFLG